MNVKETKLTGVLVLEPDVFSDERGFFLETWNSTRYENADIPGPFVQDNVSFSTKGVLRGLHFQYPQSQGKLVQVLSGRVVDVAVDIRVGSPTFGHWISEVLSDANHRQMYIPPGFAHGYYVTSETAVFSYKCTDFYNPATESGIIFNDPDLNIDWSTRQPVLSISRGSDGN
ncbi:MAG: dTDP-4-dehydrorhamnose 3,5-epimerase [Planctomycetota bacterium]|jgi:dTDP-4-dehydrorhamnose 3,5-epimerase